MHNESSRSSNSSSSSGGRSSSGCRQLGRLWGVSVVFPLLKQLLLLQQQGTHSAALNLLLVLLLRGQVWDKNYCEEKAKEKALLLGVEHLLHLLPKPRENSKSPPLPACGYRQQLQQRAFKHDFEREVSRTKMVTLQTPRMQRGGFWCYICECLCKDSQAYLDPISGRNHNQLLGMGMRVERVPLARVKAKLQAARQTAGAGLEPQTQRQKWMRLEEKEVSDEDGGNIVRQGDLGMFVRGAALLQHELQQEMLQLEKDLFRPPGP
ncbi:hypothetical protein EAH_00050030 [Eimeria acervulina]|uniref:U1-type domain-containing protein n=1 Tax=Eimeria acervulina TaxID=5801 RepID=U6GVC7_EIMAC|nr:hypothetical protein EAH_00050030 [Eimeria acervulina]CDI84216.1 hypothetical protein EAH_00050030 [Eimeria acervulina]